MVDIAEFARRRWSRDGAAKLDVMTRALADDVRGGFPVVEVWRRFKLPGRIAQRLIGMSGYQALFDVLHRNSMSPGFSVGDIAAWGGEQRMPDAAVAEILGVDLTEIETLVCMISTKPPPH
ncbi:hypothetical protein [Rhizobium ruizarguesonis]|uniref:hypothetical protein n=1 Tax=Rhizobium ruizarguesonis TaxID=2081791 RepID=UPI0010324F12|nr:hypothetical protein [Rhizobium ruizarguesonis]TBA24697.1 hypothetical protein ELH61_02295 [Rhizobium ruizarguesonis]